MTTIAYRDGVLAADSRATWDDGVASKVVKMWALPGVFTRHEHERH